MSLPTSLLPSTIRLAQLIARRTKFTDPSVEDGGDTALSAAGQPRAAGTQTQTSGAPVVQKDRREGQVVSPRTSAAAKSLLLAEPTAPVDTRPTIGPAPTGRTPPPAVSVEEREDLRTKFFERKGGEEQISAKIKSAGIADKLLEDLGGFQAPFFHDAPIKFVMSPEEKRYKLQIEQGLEALREQGVDDEDIQRVSARLGGFGDSPIDRFEKSLAISSGVVTEGVREIGSAFEPGAEARVEKNPLLAGLVEEIPFEDRVGRALKGTAGVISGAVGGAASVFEFLPEAINEPLSEILGAVGEGGGFVGKENVRGWGMVVGLLSGDSPQEAIDFANKAAESDAAVAVSEMTSLLSQLGVFRKGEKLISEASGKLFTVKEIATERIGAAKTINQFSETNVTPTSPIGEIKKAYKEGASKTHPDAGGKSGDFVKLNDAYQKMTAQEVTIGGKVYHATQGFFNDFANRVKTAMRKVAEDPTNGRAIIKKEFPDITTEAQTKLLTNMGFEDIVIGERRVSELRGGKKGRLGIDVPAPIEGIPLELQPLAEAAREFETSEEFSNQLKPTQKDIIRSINKEAPEAELFQAIYKEANKEFIVPAFHGTNQQFNNFEIKGSVKNTNAASADEAIFFTDNSAEALQYSKLANKRISSNEKLLQSETERLQDLLDKFQREGRWTEYEKTIEEFENLEKKLLREDKEVINVVSKDIDIKNFKHIDMSDVVGIDLELTQKIKEAKNEGFSGIVFENISDSPDLSSKIGPTTHYAIFDTKKILSKIKLTDFFKGTLDKPSLPEQITPGEARPVGLKDLEKIPPEKRAATEKEIEEKFIDEPVAENRAVVIDPDAIKKSLKPEDPESVHKEGSEIANKLFTKALAQDKSGVVKLTGGGTGSGKTEVVIKTIDGDPAVVFDTTLGKIDNAQKRISESLKAGKKVEIHAVYTPPADAFDFKNSRLDRIVPDEVFLRITKGFRENIPKLIEKYPEVDFQIYINRAGETGKKITFKNDKEKVAFINSEVYSETELRKIIDAKRTTDLEKRKKVPGKRGASEQPEVAAGREKAAKPSEEVEALEVRPKKLEKLDTQLEEAKKQLQSVESEMKDLGKPLGVSDKQALVSLAEKSDKAADLLDKFTAAEKKVENLKDQVAKIEVEEMKKSKDGKKIVTTETPAEVIQRQRGDTDEIIRKLKNKGFTNELINQIEVLPGVKLVDTVKVKREIGKYRSTTGEIRERNKSVSAVITKDQIANIKENFRVNEPERWVKRWSAKNLNKNLKSVAQLWEVPQVLFGRLGLKEVVYDPVRRGERAATVAASRLKKEMQDSMKISKKEAQNVQKHLINRQGRGFEGFGFDDLTGKEKKFVNDFDKVIKELEPGTFETANKLGIDLRKVKNYSPLMTKGDIKILDNGEGTFDFVVQKHPSFGPLKERLENVPQELYELDARKVAERFIEKSTEFNNLAEATIGAKYLIDSEQFKSIVGKEVQAQAKNWVRFITTPARPAEAGWRALEDVSRVVRKVAVRKILGLNPLPVAKQALSYIPLMMIEGAFPKFKAPEKLDLIGGASVAPSILERKGDITIADMQQGFDKFFTGAITGVDRQVAKTVLNGLLSKEIAKRGLTDLDVEVSSEIMRHVQDRLDLMMGGMTKAQIPPVFRSEIGKMFNAFMGQVTAQSNFIIQHLWKDKGKGRWKGVDPERGKRIAKVVTTLVLIAYMEQVVSKLSFDWDNKEGMTQDVLRSLAGNIPLLGVLFFSFDTGQGYNPAITLAHISEFSKVVGGYRSGKKDLQDLGFSIGETFLGLPSQVEKTTQGIEVITEDGFRDKSGTLKAPVEGFFEKARTFLRGKYGSQAVQDYLENIGLPAEKREYEFPQVEFLNEGDMARRVEIGRALAPEELKELLSEFSEATEKKYNRWNFAFENPDASPNELGRFLKSLSDNPRKASNVASTTQVYSHRRKAAIFDGADEDSIPSKKPEGWTVRSKLPGTETEPKTTEEGEDLKEEAKEASGIKKMVDITKLYVKALGVDPLTAIRTLFTKEQLRKIRGDAVIMERMGIKASQKVKRAGGAGPTDKLDHTIPLGLGGSNSEKNLKIVTNEEHSSYTPVENFLIKKLEAGEIEEKDAQRMIQAFKNGELTAEQITLKKTKEEAGNPLLEGL